MNACKDILYVHLVLDWTSLLPGPWVITNISCLPAFANDVTLAYFLWGRKKKKRYFLCASSPPVYILWPLNFNFPLTTPSPHSLS